mgnify:CR=1 FL=1
MKRIYFPDFLEEAADTEVATAFLEAVNETTKQLAESPFLGFTREFRNTKLRNVRVWRIKGFEKHLIFYIPKKDSIEFVYVVHSARDYTKFFDDESF